MADVMRKSYQYILFDHYTNGRVWFYNESMKTVRKTKRRGTIWILEKLQLQGH